MHEPPIARVPRWTVSVSVMPVARQAREGAGPVPHGQDRPHGYGPRCVRVPRGARSGEGGGALCHLSVFRRRLRIPFRPVVSDDDARLHDDGRLDSLGQRLPDGDTLGCTIRISAEQPMEFEQRRCRFLVGITHLCNPVVPFHPADVCPDLVQDLRTGEAVWTVILVLLARTQLAIVRAFRFPERDGRRRIARDLRNDEVHARRGALAAGQVARGQAGPSPDQSPRVRRDEVVHKPLLRRGVGQSRLDPA